MPCSKQRYDVCVIDKVDEVSRENNTFFLVYKYLCEEFFFSKYLDNDNEK